MVRLGGSGSLGLPSVGGYGGRRGVCWVRSERRRRGDSCWGGGLNWVMGSAGMRPRAGEDAHLSHPHTLISVLVEWSAELLRGCSLRVLVSTAWKPHRRGETAEWGVWSDDDECGGEGSGEGRPLLMSRARGCMCVCVWCFLAGAAGEACGGSPGRSALP